LSKFQLQAELGITAFALDSRSQSRVADSFSSHLQTVEAVLASSYGYSTVRATKIMLTSEPICARSTPGEVDASFVISFVAEGQGSAFRSDGGLTEAIREAMRDVDDGISVLTSCVSYLSWSDSGGVLPKASGHVEVDRLQAQNGWAWSRAAVMCLQLAAFTVSCFVLIFVLMQFSRLQQCCATLVGQEMVPTDEYAEQVAQQYLDYESDLEASIISSCQKERRASLDSRMGSESTATLTLHGLQSDTDVSPLPCLSPYSPESFAPGWQIEQGARYL
jgi:hypothetical protein